MNELVFPSPIWQALFRDKFVHHDDFVCNISDKLNNKEQSADLQLIYTTTFHRE